jgi:uncharacterized protein
MTMVLFIQTPRTLVQVYTLSLASINYNPAIHPTLALLPLRFYNFIMNPASHLFQLQKKDLRSSWIENRIQEIQIGLESDPDLVQAQLDEKNCKTLLEIARQEVRSIESDVEAVRIKIQTSEASLYGGRIQSPKELQDIQNEIASLKKRRSALEDSEIESMLRSEEAEAVYESSRNNLENATAQSIQNQAGLRGELSSLLAEKGRLVTEREAVVNQLHPEMIGLYEQLRKQKRGLAVALIQENACSACGTTLRPVEVQVAKSGAELVMCSTCGRILFAG